MSFRRLRILLLLGVLAAAAGLTWLEQTLVRAWRTPLEVAVVPINGDGSPEAAETIRALQASDSTTSMPSSSASRHVTA